MSEQTPRMTWPYPSAETDPWFSTFQDFVTAVDASSYAHREDRQLIMAEGGTVSWDLGSETFATTDLILLTSPITGFLWQVEAGSFVLTNGQVLYVSLPRGPGQNTSLTAVVANTIPSDDNALILAIRVNARIYARTGIVLGDGDSVAGISPGAAGGASLTVRDQDGVPSVSDVTQIRFPNGTVTDDGGGIVSVASGSLQDAYDAGNAVLAIEGAPVQLSMLSNVSADYALRVIKDGGPGAAVYATQLEDGVDRHAALIQGKVVHNGGTAANQAAGYPLYAMSAANGATQGGVVVAHYLLIDDVAAGGGADVYFLIVDGDPNGAVTSGDAGSFAFCPAKAAWYIKKDSGTSWVRADGSIQKFQQALAASVTGVTYENVGSLYIKAGTMLAGSSVFAGEALGVQTAEVELRRETGGTLIASWSVTGLLAEDALASSAVIPADDWYNVRLRCDTAATEALLKGINLVVE